MERAQAFLVRVALPERWVVNYPITYFVVPICIFLAGFPVPPRSAHDEVILSGICDGDYHQRDEWAQLWAKPCGTHYLWAEEKLADIVRSFYYVPAYIVLLPCTFAGNREYAL